MLERLFETNRKNWEARTALHAASPFYDLEGFLAGRGEGISDLERAEVGPIEGHRLLHLQCHFGLDTLAWARLGGRNPGVDLSPRAIELARQLADRLEVPADFVCANVYSLPEDIGRDFDIV